MTRRTGRRAQPNACCLVSMNRSLLVTPPPLVSLHNCARKPRVDHPPIGSNRSVTQNRSPRPNVRVCSPGRMLAPSGPGASRPVCRQARIDAACAELGVRDVTPVMGWPSRTSRRAMLVSGISTITATSGGTSRGSVKIACRRQQMSSARWARPVSDAMMAVTLMAPLADERSGVGAGLMPGPSPQITSTKDHSARKAWPSSVPGSRAGATRLHHSS